MTATAQPSSPTVTGKVVQVLGNVVDVEFTLDTLPNINDALTVHVGGSADAQSNGVSHGADGIELGGTAMQSRDLVLEVQFEIGNSQVRCLAMGSTDGLVRGAAVTSYAPCAETRFTTSWTGSTLGSVMKPSSSASG